MFSLCLASSHHYPGLQRQVLPAILLSALGLRSNGGALLGPLRYLGGGGDYNNGGGGNGGGGGGGGEDGGGGGDLIELDLRLLVLRGLLLHVLTDNLKPSRLLHRVLVAATAGACMAGLCWWKEVVGSQRKGSRLQDVQETLTASPVGIGVAAAKRPASGQAYPLPGSPSLPLMARRHGSFGDESSLSLPMPPRSYLSSEVPLLSKALAMLTLCCVLKPNVPPPIKEGHVPTGSSRGVAAAATLKKPDPLYSGSYSARAQAWAAELASAQRVEADLQHQVQKRQSNHLRFDSHALEVTPCNCFVRSYSKYPIKVLPDSCC